MTWTEFTAYLDGSRPITKAERDELYTQLEAQLADCSNRFTLNAADQAAITGSGLLCDRASLDDADLSTNDVDRLQVILDAVESVFSNYATAESGALSGEGISSGERDALIAAGVDSYKLWNYYKRLIDALDCTSTVVCAGVFTASGFGSVGTGFPRCLKHGGSPPCDGLAAGQTLYIHFDSINGANTLKVFVDGAEVYNSGSIVGDACATVALATGAEEIDFQVIASGSFPAWYYSVGCTPRVQCP